MEFNSEDESEFSSSEELDSEIAEEDSSSDLDDYSSSDEEESNYGFSSSSEDYDELNYGDAEYDYLGTHADLPHRSRRPVEHH